MKKLNFILLLLLVLSGCKSESNGSRAIASSSQLCGRYRWDESRLPLKISIDRELNDNFGSSQPIADGITKSLASWEDAIQRGSGSIFSSNITLLDSSPEHNDIALYRTDKDGANDILGVYLSKNWMSGQSSQALAVTYYTVTVNNASGLYSLTSADIIFNFRDHYFAFKEDESPIQDYVTLTDPPFNNKVVRQYDFRTVLVHELGHFIGYCHVDESQYVSVMQPYYDGKNRLLSNQDKTYIKNLYSSSALSVKAKEKIKVDPKDNEEIHFVVELLADGECNHYQEGKKFYSHKVDLSKKHSH